MQENTKRPYNSYIKVVENGLDIYTRRGEKNLVGSQA